MQKGQIQEIAVLSLFFISKWHFKLQYDVANDILAKHSKSVSLATTLAMVLIKLETWRLVHMKTIWEYFKAHMTWLLGKLFPSNHKKVIIHKLDVLDVAMDILLKLDCKLLSNTFHMSHGSCLYHKKNLSFSQLHLITGVFCIWLLGRLSWTFVWNSTANYFKVSFIWAIDHVSITKRTWDLAICICEGFLLGPCITCKLGCLD